MKTWEKPKLIVLVRGRPEETILQVCKGSSVVGAYANNFGCYSATEPATCDAISET